MAQSSPHILTSLTTREAIIDALGRALSGVDRNDVDLFNSAWAGSEASFEIDDGEKKVLPSLDFIRTHVFDKVGPMDTTHSVSNIRVRVDDGAAVASFTACSMAQHCPPGRGKEPNGPKYLVAGEYSADVIKDNEDGVWKLRKCALKVSWVQGDLSVMQGE
ncbi:hypothetical protein S7711_10045 [Stachybotrys chartarum IBT 7711]|uniref:SnoaL-like domain-containing protein n=1 Tax=Stachybotrys chartarum (strain CBS 109288 / IBT 7711) TaxID=1280523 RepID=A0A084AEX9_STACB|nr:hypothetical protein S7711_10045 [Stachybotrys chartarum IBT 7711]KFA81255.1 hypothetical protein S40288_09990 [Stachybotrys chartarum IBT 40288]